MQQSQQVPQVMQNQSQVSQAGSITGVTNRSHWKTWQSDEDMHIRRDLIHQIITLFQQRKPNVTSEWQQKLPDFVQRLEEMLYRTAATKEEYSDYSTLDARLQRVARNMVSRPSDGSAQQQQVQQMNQMSQSLQGGPQSLSQQQQFLQQQKLQQQQQKLAMVQQQGVGGMQLMNNPISANVAVGMGGQMMNQGMQVLQGNPQSGQQLGQGQQSQQMRGNQQSTGGGMVQMPAGGGQGQGQGDLMSVQMLGPGQQQQGNSQQGGPMQLNMSNMSQQQQMQLRQMQGQSMNTNGGGMQQMQQQNAQQQMRLQQQGSGGSGAQGVMQGGAPGTLPNQGGDASQAQTQQDQQRVYIGKQQRWLLLLRHASKCSVPPGMCSATPHCQVAKQLVHHVTQCQDNNCAYPRCVAARDLLRHHMRCQEASCVICTPVREYMSRQKGGALQNPRQQQLRTMQQQQQQQGMLNPQQGGQMSQQGASPQQQQQQQMLLQQQQQLLQQQQQQQQGTNQLLPGSTMVPLNLQGSPGLGGNNQISALVPADAFGNGAQNNQVSPMVPNQTLPHNDQNPSVSNSIGPNQLNPSTVQMQQSNAASQPPQQHPKPDLSQSKQAAKRQRREPAAKQMQAVGETAGDVKPGTSAPASAFPQLTDNLGDNKPSTSPAEDKALLADTAHSDGVTPPKPNPSDGTSLLETFTPAEVTTHLEGLRAWAKGFTAQNQSKRGKEANAALQAATGSGKMENQCKSCGLERLLFEPPPLYCGTCGVRIKRNQVHYVANPPQAASSGAGEVTKHLCCVPCFNDIKGDMVELEGGSVPKTSLEKRKNDEEQLEEAWVECDKCNSWHHQICVLFNGRRNEGEKTVFHCPLCIKADMESGLRQTVVNRSQAQLPAESLPRTKLTEFLEQRLRLSLSREREERARRLEKPVEEVETAQGLSVRLVSNIDKKLETRARFGQAFPNFPTEFPYRSKVLLLFQRLDGADVCIFAMYMQEYGADAPAPNTRRIYLSYLDSIKYFRPEVSSSRNSALRTYVYHEILVGYLQYVKVRGFTSIYIWACPPLAGEDYILYCHPQKQKTPKSDKLRAWYQNMLIQAKSEKIVTHIATIYDTFFQAGREKETKSAAEMPYFDGDYWPGSADEQLAAMEAEKDKSASKGHAKQSTVKNKSSGKAARGKVASHGVGTARLQPFDAQLMNQLGEVLGGLMKEDFIIAHLHHCCTHCGNYITNGPRYFVEEGPHIELCKACYDADQARDRFDQVQYTFKKEEMRELRDTRDPDDAIESEFFDTRQAFLSLCQGNHFQFDALRRAKHSSMMVLYHLHNPSEPAFVSSCNMCQGEVPAGSGWRCTVCPDYDMCDACYRRDPQRHPHEMKPHSRDGIAAAVMRGPRGAALSEDERKQRVANLQRTMALLVHASACNQAQCNTPDCHKVKTLFKHGVDCPKKAAGGCHCCRRVCTLLHVHAKSCKSQTCPVPRCRELKEYRRRLQTQMEDRRRQNAMAMYRGQQKGQAASPST